MYGMSSTACLRPGCCTVPTVPIPSIARAPPSRLRLSRANLSLTLSVCPLCVLLQNGINVLQAAAFATQAALNNPALQPILMAGSNPWLNSIYQTGNVMGLVNPSAAANPAAAAAALANAQLAQVPSAHLPAPGTSPPMLDPSTLSAAAQYGGPLAQQGGSRESPLPVCYQRDVVRLPALPYGSVMLFEASARAFVLLLFQLDDAWPLLLQGMGTWSAGE